MMKTYVSFFAFCAATVGAMGCGSNGVPMDELDDAYVEAICEQVRACPGTLGEIGIISSVLGGNRQATCEELLTNAGFASPPRETAGVEAGTIEYDAAAARRCVAELARTCAGFEAFEAIEDCRNIFIGQVAVGDTCQDTAECVPGSYCLTTQACGGTCTAKVATGAPCDRDEECLSDPGAIASCTDTQDNPDDHCIQMFVESDRALGETCGEVDGDGDTQTYAICAGGAYCRTENSDIGTCATPLAVGANCTNDDVCLDSVCNDDTGVCTSVIVRTTAGETCDEETYTFCDGRAHLSCSDLGVCETIGDGKEGALCATESSDFLFTFFTCEPGLVCGLDGMQRTCMVPLPDGAVCDAGLECESGFCSDDSVCSAPILCEP